MTRLAVVLLWLFVASCTLFRSSEEGAAAELTEIAALGTDATYAAAYRFAITGPLAAGQTTRMEITQDPPASVRKLEVFTNSPEGEPIRTASWLARTSAGTFACAEYPELGVRCQPNPLDAGTFGSATLDAFFDTPRVPDAYESVAKARRTVRVAGQVGTCFEATPPSPTPPPVSSPQPSFVPERFRFELCYTEEGILLHGRRTILGEVPADIEERRETVVEAVSVSRVVQRRELELPGPVAEPEDLRP